MKALVDKVEMIVKANHAPMLSGDIISKNLTKADEMMTKGVPLMKFRLIIYLRTNIGYGNIWIAIKYDYRYLSVFQDFTSPKNSFSFGRKTPSVTE